MPKPKVKRVEVESTPVLSFDIYASDGCDDFESWMVSGSIVRVRVRGDLNGSTPAELRAKLLEAGAVAAHVTVEPKPEPRKARVEGLSSFPSPRERMRAYLTRLAVEPGAKVDHDAHDALTAEVWRILDEEGV